MTMKKPINSRVSSRPDKWWKLNLLADVVAAMSEYEKSEVHQIDEEAKIFVAVPRKKRSRLSRRSSSMATQWTTRVIEKQRSITCAEDYKEEERCLKKRKIVRRFEVSPSSISTELEQKRLLIQNPNPVPSTSSSSSVVTECKKRKTIRRLSVEPAQQDTTIPKWLLELMMSEDINGYDPKLIVARKVLYKSDLDKVQSRLSMPLNQVVSSDFLTEEETRYIYEQSILKTRKEGISVVLVDPLNLHVVDLRKWKMNGNWTYVFVDGWNDVVSKNKFNVGEVYPVWSFRSGGGMLCFALVPPEKNSSDSEHGGHSSSGQSCLSSR